MQNQETGRFTGVKLTHSTKVMTVLFSALIVCNPGLNSNSNLKFEAYVYIKVTQGHCFAADVI